MNMTPGKLAFYCAVAGSVVIIAVLAVFMLLSIQIAGPALTILAMVIACHVAMYYVSKWAFTKWERRWQISLKEGDAYVTFDKGAYLRFYMGFVWRFAVINIISTPFTDKIFESASGTSAGLAQILCGSVAVFLSCLWLFKHPYGNVRLNFLVTYNDTGIAQEVVAENNETQPLPVEIDATARKASSESVFSVAGQILTGSFSTVMLIAYIGIGLLQFAATYDFFREVWEWWLIPSLIFSGIVSYIPLIGNIAGFYAAYTVWEWPFWGAFLLFFWPLVLFAAALVIGAVQLIFEKR